MVKIILALGIAGALAKWAYNDFRDGRPVPGTIGALISLLNVAVAFTP